MKFNFISSVFFMCLNSFVFTLSSQVSLFSYSSIDQIYDTSQSINGQLIDVTNSNSTFDFKIGCRNNGSQSVSFYFRRLILDSSPNFLDDQLCDDALCYSPITFDYITQLPTNIASNEIGGLKSTFNFDSPNGFVNVRYYVLGMDSSKIDSVDFVLNRVLSSNIFANQVAFKIYNSSNNIFISNLNNEFGIKLKLYDLIGNIVFSKEIIENKQVFNFKFSNGVYIAIIEKNGFPIKSQKLVHF